MTVFSEIFSFFNIVIALTTYKVQHLNSETFQRAIQTRLSHDRISFASSCNLNLQYMSSNLNKAMEQGLAMMLS